MVDMILHPKARASINFRTWLMKAGMFTSRCIIKVGHRNLRYVDLKTGFAYTAGSLFFEPVSGSRLEITIPITLQTVRTSQPILITVPNPDEDQSLQIGQSLSFGEITAIIKSVEWKSEGNFELRIDGSTQEGDLSPACLYLYQDPRFPPSDYQGCFIDDAYPTDLTQTIAFDSLPDFSNPMEVGAAVDVVFLTPFRFTWIRP